MTERERLVASLNATEACEVDAYFEMVAACERHRRLEDTVNVLREKLRGYDAEHPEEVPVLPEVTLDDVV